MKTSRLTQDSPSVAVWYFVGATFAFAAPTLWFADAAPWIRIAFLVVGMLAIVGGAVHIGRATRQRSRTDARSDADAQPRTDARPDTDPRTHTDGRPATEDTTPGA